MYVRWMGRGLYLIHTIFRDNTLNYTDELGKGTKYDNYDDTRGGEGCHTHVPCHGRHGTTEMGMMQG